MNDALAAALIIISPGFPESEEDTTCLPAQQIFVKALKNNFPSTEVIILSFQYPFTNKSYSWNGIAVIPFNGKNRGGLHRLRVWVSAFFELKKISKEKKIVGLFSFWCTECALVGKYFGSLHGIKHVSWISGQDARSQNSFVKLIRPRSGELVAMSEFLSAEFYRNHAVRPGKVIHNGIDTTEFDTSDNPRNIDICAVGSLIPLKQYGIFIQVVRKLKMSIPGISSLICGKGPEEKKLSLLIKNYGLENNISLAGEKSHPEVLGTLRRSRVFLHPSSYEGLSSVCLEALYAGAHVISFTDPGFGEMKHWHVVKDEDEMFDKALELLSSGSINHEPVLAYSMDDSAREVMRLFSFF